MLCPDCGTKGYRRKTKTPEWRCGAGRDCGCEWDDPYIDGPVGPSLERTLEGGCPECGARGYTKYIWVEGRGEWSGSLNDPYPEENYKGCIACGNEWAISDYVQEQEERERNAEMARKRFDEMIRREWRCPSCYKDGLGEQDPRYCKHRVWNFLTKGFKGATSGNARGEGQSFGPLLDNLLWYSITMGLPILLIVAIVVKVLN